jgi:hypothetical protein
MTSRVPCVAHAWRTRAGDTGGGSIGATRDPPRVAADDPGKETGATRRVLPDGREGVPVPRCSPRQRRLDEALKRTCGGCGQRTVVDGVCTVCGKRKEPQRA